MYKKPPSGGFLVYTECTMNFPFFNRERKSAVPAMRELDANRICENEAVVDDQVIQDLVANYRQVQFGSTHIGGSPQEDENRLTRISVALEDVLRSRFGISLSEGETMADFIDAFPEIAIN